MLNVVKELNNTYWEVIQNGHMGNKSLKTPQIPLQNLKRETRRRDTCPWFLSCALIRRVNNRSMYLCIYRRSPLTAFFFWKQWIERWSEVSFISREMKWETNPLTDIFNDQNRYVFNIPLETGNTQLCGWKLGTLRYQYTWSTNTHGKLVKTTKHPQNCIIYHVYHLLKTLWYSGTCRLLETFL